MQQEQFDRLHNPERADLEKSSIATPWGGLRNRVLAGIKYAKEIQNAYSKLLPDDKEIIKPADPARANKRIPMYEIRYKLDNKLLAESGIEQVLEVPGGFSPRGLELTEQDPQMSVVEMDIPEVAKLKKRVLEELYSSGATPRRENLKVEEGSILDPVSLEAATKNFQQKPIAVIMEGLLRYYDFQERKLIAQNIKTLLERFGGIWITSDIIWKRGDREEDDEKNQATHYSAELLQKIAANRFASESEAQKFFEDLGFVIEKHPYEEVVDGLETVKKLNLDPEQVRTDVANRMVYVMRVKA